MIDVSALMRARHNLLKHHSMLLCVAELFTLSDACRDPLTQSDQLRARLRRFNAKPLQVAH